MRFRLPTPVHGWRSFWNEIVIVVIGVLIAIGATELVKNHNDRRDLRHAREVLKAEVYQHVKNMIERIVTEPCQIGRITELREKLRRSDGRWTADPSPWKTVNNRQAAFPVVYRAPLRPWRREAWAMAVSSDVVRHMDREEVARYSAYYTAISRIAQINDGEAALSAQLHVLAFDQRLDRQTIILMQSTLSELDYHNERMAGGSRQLLNGIAAANVGFSPKELDADTATIVRDQRDIRGDCANSVKVSL